MNTTDRVEIKRTITRYVIGFMLSLICTLLAYVLVYTQVEHGGGLDAMVVIPLLGILAFSQFVVQLVYFLHLGTERKPRWKLMVFWFMIVIVAIIVIGSIWIMDNLNYNMMHSPEATQQYIDKNQGF